MSSKWSESILDLPTEHRAVKKHGHSPQPECLTEGGHGRQAVTGTGTKTKGHPHIPLLPHSLRLHHTLCSSQKLNLKISISRKGSFQGLPKLLLKSCPFPSLPSPYNGLLHISFPSKENLFLPLLLWSLTPSRTPFQAHCWTCCPYQCCHEFKAHMLSTDFTEGAGIPVRKCN